jgi:rod shape-determining protein MreC
MINRDFRATAKIQRSRVDGIVAWETGQFLLLKNVAKTMDVKPGDVVITSEYSNVFPPNIEIGIIAHVSDETGTLFKQIEIAPNVDFSKLEEVFVMKSLPDSMRNAFEKKFQEAQ